MIPVQIRGATGKTYGASVTPEGALEVIVHTHPPAVEANLTQPFRQFFKTSAGSSDMLVNGSTTNVDFDIKAVVDFDLHIKSVSITIAQQNSVLNKFANITALSNGCQFCWETQDLGVVIIHDAIKTNYDLMQIAGGQPAIGDGTSAFRASNIISTSEGYMAFIDFQAIFGLPFGLRLRKNSKDRLFVRIRDDVSAPDRFDAVGYGLKI